jgi:hypothetical protein
MATSMCCPVPVRLPGHPQHSGHALRHDVEPGPGRVRPGLPEGADRAVKDVGPQRLHVVVGQAEPGGDAGPERLHDQVGLAGQLQRECPAPGILHVEGDGPLAPVGLDERPGLTAFVKRTEIPGIVAGHGLDLDHVRAEVGENHRRVRPGEEPGQVEDAEAGERQRRAARGIHVHDRRWRFLKRQASCALFARQSALLTPRRCGACVGNVTPGTRFPVTRRPARGAP